MKRVAWLLALVAGISLVPTSAHAQATIAGAVRDASGAVLPGVTVEASSAALIERVRGVVTDATGQYRIVDLRPGSYTVTFTLPGFSIVKREGIELTGSFVATVNAELRVGTVEETITVTGEAPAVDVQSTNKQSVMNTEVIDALPTGRTFGSLGALIPGVVGSNVAANQDVGGSMGDIMGVLSAHGGKSGDQKILQNGTAIVDLQTAGGGQSGASPNMGATQEVVIEYVAASAELATGGVRINFIPKDGGNLFKGSVFGTFATEDMANSNFTPRLKDRGLTLVNSMKKNWDVNPGFGGPIKKDKAWFYFTVRWKGAENYAAGMFHNKNEFLPNVWIYEPDLARPALSLDGEWLDEQIRLTWQATPRHKFAGTWGNNLACNCPRSVSATQAPEASWDRRFPAQRTLMAEWTSPYTNKLLFEGVAFHKTLRWCDCHLQPSGGGLSPSKGSLEDITAAQLAAYPFLVGVTEQTNGLNYHGPGLSRPTAPFTNTWIPNYFFRAAVSYITGAHSLKVGYNDSFGYMVYETYGPSPQVPYRYRFNNGVPNQLTLFALPFTQKNDQDHDLGLFAQHRWTVNRLTINTGLRYDWFKSSYPEQSVGPALLAPNRNFTFPAEENLNWKDVTYRSGFAYDLNGDGRTALKIGLNKYLAGQALGGLGSNTNPLQSLSYMTTRNWTDANRDFVPQCDLISPAAHGECGPLANSNFGTAVRGEVRDLALRTGWGNRGYNWEFSTGIQREILPRVSVDVGYFRRWYGNFAVTDDLNLSPADYDTFSITAPSNPLLPGGGGYQISGLNDLKPSVFGRPSNNRTSLSKDYGKQIEHWNGFDISVQARLDSGVLLAGGTSTGKTTTDNCEILAKLPEMAPNATSEPFCHVETPMLTQVKGIAAYTVPRVDILLSAAFQSMPGNIRLATFTLPGAAAAQALGRPLAGNAPNYTVPLIPGSVAAATGVEYGERMNLLDLRVGKIIRAGGQRVTVSLDIYNATNADTVLADNPNYAVLYWPTSILQSRFFKFSAQYDF